MIKCKHPLSIVVDGKYYEVGCGKCRHCLNTRRSEWSQRLQMEYNESVCSKFVTITYDDAHLPPLYSFTSEDGEESFMFTLNKRHCQLFLKRLRKNFTDSFGKFKYFLVGEFGDRKSRPHYHILMFFDQRVENDELHIAILKCWQKGYIIDVQDMRGIGACKYVADYMYKQLGDDGLIQDRFEEEVNNRAANRDKWLEIKSRPKTFMLASRRPAIGLSYLKNRNLVKYHLADPVGRCTYRPKGAYQDIAVPLCRYIRNKLYDNSALDIIRSALEEKTKLERENFEKSNPIKDWNTYVKQTRKFHDFKLKLKQK